jgi:uncharacterized protein (DUF924 family)
METKQTILQFWFGMNADDKAVAAGQSKLWWSKNPQTDKQIQQRFEPTVAKAANRELDSWLETPIGRLALILLTDQFPRNMCRGTANAFAFDHLARSWCKEGIGKDVHKALRPIERVFFYLPLEHSESLEDQEQSIALCEELVAGVDAEHKPTFEGFLRFAVRHRDIVRRFGRFPHRNAILGRESTPEELAFLEEKGSSF